MPPSNIHMSLAQDLNSASQYPVHAYRSFDQSAVYWMIFLERYIALAAMLEGVYFNILCSINGSSIK